MALLSKGGEYSLEQLSTKIKKQFKISISPNMLGKIERGETRVQTDVFISYCKFFNVGISYFFAEIELPSIPDNLNKLINIPEGRECLKYLANYADQPDLMEFVLDFLKVTLPKIENLKKKNLKEKILLKASSPEK